MSEPDRMEERKALRKALIRARNGLTPDERAEKSARAVELLVQSEAFRAARTVMIYDHVGGENSDFAVKLIEQIRNIAA